ncbi:MAG: transglutaminase domain-containing protein [Candidatus Omnitrophica bacterium]|nr:transglutaminase domain-containing protein [Candidatus Omnitrophota bacterium]
MRCRQRGVLLDVVIFASWLGSVGLVIVHEGGGFFGPFGGNPSTTLRASLEAKEQWFAISYQGHRVGFSNTTLVPSERDGVPGVEISDRGRLSFNLLGIPQDLDVNARAFIDADWRLQFLTASLRSATTNISWVGRRHGDALEVTVTTPSSTVSKRFRDPAGSAFVNGLSSWAAFHQLRVGQSGTAWVINPLAMNPEPVFFLVRRSEPLDGTTALVVESDVSGLTAMTWVTAEGEVLKETSPLGWELRRTTREEALKPLAGMAPGLDLLSTTSIPLDRPIAHPQAVSRLVLLVEGLAADEVARDRPWQQALPRESLPPRYAAPRSEPWCVLQLTRPSRTASPAAVSDKSLQRYQQSTLFVQAHDPRILAKAREIIGARSDAWEQTVALQQWVYHAMVKQLSVGLPSAVDILATPVGDCHEHTVLFTALSRSLGIPTRMMAGVVYWNGALYYHAWPEVWVDGQWLPTDPTLDQPLADATHLALSEAEDAGLMALGQFIGKLRVHILEITE